MPSHIIIRPPPSDFQTFWHPCEAYQQAFNWQRMLLLQKTNAKVLEAVSKKALLIEVAANSITMDISSPIWV